MSQAPKKFPNRLNLLTSIKEGVIGFNMMIESAINVKYL